MKPPYLAIDLTAKNTQVELTCAIVNSVLNDRFAWQKHEFKDGSIVYRSTKPDQVDEVEVWQTPPPATGKKITLESKIAELMPCHLLEVRKTALCNTLSNHIETLYPPMGEATTAAAKAAVAKAMDDTNTLYQAELTRLLANPQENFLESYHALVREHASALVDVGYQAIKDTMAEKGIKQQLRHSTEEVFAQVFEILQDHRGNSAPIIRFDQTNDGKKLVTNISLADASIGDGTSAHGKNLDSGAPHLKHALCLEVHGPLDKPEQTHVLNNSIGLASPYPTNAHKTFKKPNDASDALLTKYLASHNESLAQQVPNMTPDQKAQLATVCLLYKTADNIQQAQVAALKRQHGTLPEQPEVRVAVAVNQYTTSHNSFKDEKQTVSFEACRRAGLLLDGHTVDLGDSRSCEFDVRVSNFGFNKQWDTAMLSSHGKTQQASNFDNHLRLLTTMTPALPDDLDKHIADAVKAVRALAEIAENSVLVPNSQTGNLKEAVANKIKQLNAEIAIQKELLPQLKTVTTTEDAPGKALREQKLAACQKAITCLTKELDYSREDARKIADIMDKEETLGDTFSASAQTLEQKLSFFTTSVADQRAVVKEKAAAFHRAMASSDSVEQVIQAHKDFLQAQEELDTLLVRADSRMQAMWHQQVAAMDDIPKAMTSLEQQIKALPLGKPNREQLEHMQSYLHLQQQQMSGQLGQNAHLSLQHGIELQTYAEQHGVLNLGGCKSDNDRGRLYRIMAAFVNATKAGLTPRKRHGALELDTRADTLAPPKGGKRKFSEAMSQVVDFIDSVVNVDKFSDKTAKLACHKTPSFVANPRTTTEAFAASPRGRSSSLWSTISAAFSTGSRGSSGRSRSSSRDLRKVNPQGSGGNSKTLEDLTRTDTSDPAASSSSSDFDNEASEASELSESNSDRPGSDGGRRPSP